MSGHSPQGKPASSQASPLLLSPRAPIGFSGGHAGCQLPLLCGHRGLAGRREPRATHGAVGHQVAAGAGQPARKLSLRECLEPSRKGSTLASLPS